MKYAVIILIIGAFLAGQSESKLKPSKLLRKISIKSYRHLAQKGAKSLLTASLFSGIGTPDHGHNWSFDYYDKKFATISSTFEMLQAEIETLANIIEATEKTQAKHWYDGLIMKIVIFTLITFLLGATGFILYKMKTNVYLKRMQSLIKSLANLKSELKEKRNVAKMKEDVDIAHQRAQQMEEGFQLLNEQATQIA